MTKEAANFLILADIFSTKIMQDRKKLSFSLFISSKSGNRSRLFWWAKPWGKDIKNQKQSVKEESTWSNLILDSSIQPTPANSLIRCSRQYG